MASSANPDLWSDLSGFGSSDGSNADARAALLKVNAEMFVAAAARDRESIETFEALVLGFLPKTDPATLLDLARILAPCPDTPTSVLDCLAQHSPEAREILRHHAARLPPAFGSRQLATPEGRLSLASRTDLDPTTIQKLLALRESTVEDALASNPAFAPDTAPFTDLVRRARHRPTLAAILLERADLPTAGQASLYLAADAERRKAIRERVAVSLAHRRVTLSFTLTEQDLAELLAAGFKGDDRRLEGLLTSLFGFPASTEWRVLEIGRHRLLALALKVLGVTHKDAIRLFITLHPALSYPLSVTKALVREMRDVSSPVALALIESVLDVRTFSGEALA
ncbi:hypothetical protein [Microvirga tunisiensis]|uniref:DUF2336 domain-containing protein n=1 Tax=Microvirga tunisiensis TaxID=2108360 RepID=A0A5N7MM79_9HYPH|nr:hypothetical protein [Microvirga tunisiensis]MPR09915.1 DUF2336 domain-containing protein [Microvirga tunisiensis]MPR28107.1 DUF2336 domain-containing protein [Microvirga tunisiensis]